MLPPKRLASIFRSTHLQWHHTSPNVLMMWEITKTIKPSPEKKTCVNGEVRGQKSWLSVRWQESAQHCQSKTRSCYRGGNGETSAETGDLMNSSKEIWQAILKYHRLQKQEHQQHVWGHGANELNTFCYIFHLPNKESAVWLTLPPEDRPLEVSTVDVRKKPAGSEYKWSWTW